MLNFSILAQDNQKMGTDIDDSYSLELAVLGSGVQVKAGVCKEVLGPMIDKFNMPRIFYRLAEDISLQHILLPQCSF